MKTAFLFPGQGAQFVGMGKDVCEAFPAAAKIFDCAEAATGLALRKLCFEGPEDELSRTDISQPAIFTVSAAILEAMKQLLGDKMPRPDGMAGLSLGEYTALYASGAADFETTVKLVARRGELMQRAAVAVPSGMVSVLGLDEQKAGQLCAAASNGQVLTCANFNCPGQVVLSGQLEACQRAEQMAKDFGASGAIPLKVAGAFHSDIMKPAAEGLAKVLADVKFSRPTVDVISNVDARCYDGTAEIPTKLVAQLVNPVRWQQSIEYLFSQGFDKFYEIGPGKVLSGLMRRINRRTDITCLNSAEAMKKLAAG